MLPRQPMRLHWYPKRPPVSIPSVPYIIGVHLLTFNLSLQADR